MQYIYFEGAYLEAIKARAIARDKDMYKNARREGLALVLPVGGPTL